MTSESLGLYRSLKFSTNDHFNNTCVVRALHSVIDMSLAQSSSGALGQIHHDQRLIKPSMQQHPNPGSHRATVAQTPAHLSNPSNPKIGPQSSATAFPLLESKVDPSPVSRFTKQRNHQATVTRARERAGHFSMLPCSAPQLSAREAADGTSNPVHGDALNEMCACTA